MKRLLIALLALGAANSITPAMACLGYAPGSCVWVDTSSYGSWSATPALGAPGGYQGSLTFWGASNGYATLTASDIAGNVTLKLPPASGTLATTASIASALPSITAAQLYGGTGSAGVAQEFTQGTNSVLGNATAGTAAPTALSVPSCSGSGSGLTWTSSSGFGCGTNLPALTAGLTLYVRTVPVTCTISNGSPAIATKISHGLSIGDPVIFNISSGGSLPAGITAGTVYYVITAGYGANSFEFSTVPGGTAVNTSSAGSGTFSFQTGNDANPGTAQTRAGALLSIQQAVNIANGVDSQGYTITASVADGYYFMTEVDFNHPRTETLQIIGDTATPANVQLNFDAANYASGFKAQYNGVLGLLDGVTISGNGWASYGVWTGATNPYGSAIYAYQGGNINVGYNVYINNFYYGLRAELGGSIYAANNGSISVTITQCGDVGIHAFDGGHIEARYANVSYCADTAQSLGFGIAAENGGSIVTNNSLSTYNAKAGFYVLNGGSMWAQNTNGSHNGAYGYYAIAGGSIDASSSVASYNTTNGYACASRGMIVAYGSETDHSGADGYYGNNCTIDVNSSYAQYNTGISYHALNQTAFINSYNSGSTTGNGTNAPVVDSTSTMTSINAPHALSVVSCTIPDTAGTGVNFCSWKAGNSGDTVAYFDDFSVTYASTCSTTYPIVEIYDVTQSSVLGSTTVPNTSTTITSVNATASGATATDTYAFRVTTGASGCSTTLATEFIYLTATVRN